MKSFQRVGASIALFAVLLTACATTHSGGAADSAALATTGAAHKALLPSPSGPLDLSVAPGATLSLDEMLQRLSKLTGVTYSTDGSIGDHLKSTKVMLSQDKNVPVAEVYPWVEYILLQNGYTLALLHNGDAPLVGVCPHSAKGTNPSAIKVDPDRLDECRAHPAFLFTTVLLLPHTDVGSVGNSLRILGPDTQTGGVIPAGSSQSVVLSGSGREVVDLATILQTIEAQCALLAAPPKVP